ncbi:Myb-related protein [Nymphaea thermarum]|nr:Myb-related protein [Nymphaea thermarum]
MKGGRMVEVVHEEAQTRKGPWTEQEDLQLVGFVGLFGERRWDFIAKVSGLNRTGKSCRLRWVNYLRPDLKHGRMTPQEESLVLELHARWGNRWSRIARKLPGRTDNEIKNYWRTHMRKKAQERSLSENSSLLSSPCSYSTSLSSDPRPARSMVEGEPPVLEKSAGVMGSCEMSQRGVACEETAEASSGPGFMEQMWKEIAASETLVFPVYESEGGSALPCNSMASPLWEYSCDSLWKMDEEEFSVGDHFL